MWGNSYHKWSTKKDCESGISQDNIYHLCNIAYKYLYLTHTYYKESEPANTLMTRGSQKSDDLCFLEFFLMLPKLWNRCFGIPCPCLLIALLIHTLVYSSNFWVLVSSYHCTGCSCVHYPWQSSCIWIYLKADYKKYVSLFTSFMMKIVYDIRNKKMQRRMSF